MSLHESVLKLSFKYHEHHFDFYLKLVESLGFKISRIGMTLRNPPGGRASFLKQKKKGGGAIDYM